METIFLDESGYTGEHLLDPSQPIFALASVHLDEEVCTELKSRFFAPVRATELKYSQLRRRGASQKLVMDFVSWIAREHSHDVKIYVAEKRYALAAKVVDVLVEKAEHALGGNLYEHHPERAATALFFILGARGGESFLDEFLTLFAAFVRNPTPGTYDAFFGFVRSRHPDAFVDQMFDFIRATEQMFGRSLISRQALGSLDLAIAMAFALVNWWQMDLQAPLRVIHDQSSNMARQGEVWNAIVDPANPVAVVGAGSRVAEFPVNVHETMFAPSHEWAGLQIADVLAGAAAAMGCVYCGVGEPEDFERTLAEPLLALTTQAIVPVPPGYEDPPATKHAASSDLPSFMAEILRTRRT